MLVFGGSQGARSINQAAVEAFAGSSFRVLHAAGERDLPSLRSPGPHYDLRGFIDDFSDALAASDLVVGRAGGSVFEIAAAGRPAVLIPYPHATADHQTTNARYLESAGAAVVIPDAELSGPRLGAGGRSAAGRSLAARGDGPRLRAVWRDRGPRRDRGRGAACRRPLADVDDWSDRRLHFVGIGGAGMSGLALIAHVPGSAGDRVGSRRDATTCPSSGRLGSSRLSATRRRTFRQEPRLSTPRRLAPDNPERVAAAREHGGRGELHRADLLAQLAELKRCLAVTGTHGKTTTTGDDRACPAGLRSRSGLRRRWRASRHRPNAAWGSGEWIVVEADESDRSLLKLRPEVAVLTNAELDHHATYAHVSTSTRPLDVPGRRHRCGRLGSTRAARARGWRERIIPYDAEDP